MQLTCTKENLARGIATAVRAVPSRTTLPVTSHLLLQTEDGTLKITGTDLSTLISTWIPCMVLEEGAVTVPAKLLQDYINSLSADTVELNRNPENRVLNLVAGRSRTHINGGLPAEFPPTPDLEGDPTAKTVPISVAAMRNAISKVSMAASTEESRPVLTGIQMVLHADHFVLAAADGFRLAVHKQHLETMTGEGTAEEAGTEPTEVIIPARSMVELNRLLAAADDMVNMTAGRQKGSVMFTVTSPDRTLFISNLLQGEFPDWSRLIPADHQAEFTLDSGALVRAVRTAAIFAKDGSNIVRINYGKTPKEHPRMNISASSEEIGQNMEQLPMAEISGEPGCIAFNHRFLQEAVQANGPGLITIKTTTPSSPGLVQPKDNDDTLHVIMPMFVQW